MAKDSGGKGHDPKHDNKSQWNGKGKPGDTADPSKQGGKHDKR